jgi:transposase-like protein
MTQLCHTVWVPRKLTTPGIVFPHEAVREWEAQLAPVLSDMLRKHRRGRIGPSWDTDETYLKVRGRWRYRYRAIDREGNLIDVLLSEKRDKAAAEAFCRSARMLTGSVPERVTTAGRGTYPGAIKAELGATVKPRTNRYLNNHLEQDHRGIKQRTHPLGGFKRVESAKRFCQVHDEVRNFPRSRPQRNERISLVQRRLLSTARTRILLTSLAAA